MAIQMRRGLLANYDKSKMLAGEWAIPIDEDTNNQKAFIAFAPGVDKEVMFVEDAAEQIAEATAEAIDMATEEAEAWAHGNSFHVNDYASGDGSTRAFTLAETPSSILGVYVDGSSVSAYTLSWKTITFTTAPASGSNNIRVYYTVNTTTDNAKYYKEQAEAVAESIPEDYSDLSDDVDQLKNALNRFYSDETETGKIFRFGESDGVLKVVSDSEVTVGNQNIMPNTLSRDSSNPVTENGLTYYKNADGSVVVSGTATANTSIWVNQTLTVPQGAYTLSGCPSGGSASTYRINCVYRIDGVDSTWLIDYGNGATAELTTDIDNIRCYILIFKGATVDEKFYPQLEYSSAKSDYAKCENETVSANTEISIDGIKTIFANTAFNLTDTKHWLADDILSIQNDIRTHENQIDNVQTKTLTLSAQLNSGSNVNIANIKNLSEKCIHHDNFSRTESGYSIGKNSEGTLTNNSYDTVTGASSDDGVRVDNGLTISADSTRPFTFTVRKIATAHTSNFMVEFNAPASGQSVLIIYKLTDANNFTAIDIGYNGIYYGCIQKIIENGSLKTIIDQNNIYDSTGYVIRLYFLSGVIAVFIADKYCYSFYADNIDDYLYIGSYKGQTAHLDFINMFDLITPLVWNSEYLTDNDVSALPSSTISANADRYALSSENTRFSNRSEHFMLYSTDEKIYNGRRTERSLVALIPENLRTMRYEFDVLFPASVLPDTATGSYADVFFQLHDRQEGVSRGNVPFHLSLVGDEIHFSQSYASEQASETLIPVASELNLGKVTYGEWMRFDILIHERYEERQQPFMEIKINGKVVYQSRKPNCANDVHGTSAQYGEYKNNFDLITYSERYVDNFKVTY